VRYVTITQNIADWHWPSDEVLTELANLHAASHANFFVAQGNIDLVAKQLGEPVRNAALVRNPFNVSYDVQLEWPPEDGVYHLACVAQLTPLHKGQDLILEVLRRPQWRSRAIDLTFVGTGPNRKHLAALADSYGLHNVKFAGFQADIPRVWASNHLMILASRCEGTPLAVVEALLCGRPCIVTRVAGNAEVVEEGVSGFIAAAPTADLLDDAMERAWSKRHEWKRMGESASVRIRELVPSDPVELFANELIVSGTRQRH
jgi:glycosyltransferase involved in cell wall biosynthesis